MKIIYPSKEEEKKINAGIKLDPDAREWTDEMFSRAVRGKQKTPTKNQLTVRFDADIVEWFKSKGTGYQSRMNNALRQFIDENESRV